MNFMEWLNYGLDCIVKTRCSHPYLNKWPVFRDNVPFVLPAAREESHLDTLLAGPCLASLPFKKQMCFLTCDVSPLNFWVTDWWAAALTGCCLWARSKVIACFVTFPCKLRLMAPINFQGIQNYSVRWWLFDIVPLSHSDKDNCFKLAPGYWLL